MQFLARIAALFVGVAVFVLFVLPMLTNGGKHRAPTGSDAQSTGSVSVATKLNQPGAAAPQHTLPYQQALDARYASIEKGHAIAVQKPAPKRYFRVRVTDGGTLKAGRTVIHLRNIEARPADAKCTDSKGRSWPCGAAARAALQHFIRWRAVSCVAPAAGGRNEFSSRCSIGETDLSVWMVRQGWASNTDAGDDVLASAERSAKSDHAGFWGDPVPRKKALDALDQAQPVDTDALFGGDVGGVAGGGSDDRTAPVGSYDQ